MSHHTAESIMKIAKRLERGLSEDKTLYLLEKLDKYEVSVELLKETGIGRIVRKLSKEKDGQVGSSAKHLCSKWKSLVREAADEKPESQPETSNTNHAGNHHHLKSNSRHCHYKKHHEDSEEGHSRHRDDHRRHGDDKHRTESGLNEKSKDDHDEEKGSSQDRHSQYESKRREGIDESKALKRSKPFIGEQSSSQKRGEDQVDNRNTSKPQSMPHHQHHHSKDRLSSSKSMDTRPKTEPMKEMPSLLSRKPVLQPLDKMDILAELPVDNHGLGTSSGMQKLVEESKPKLNPMLGFTSRKARTTVYSGHARTTHYTHVLKLEELCLRVLMDNIDKITYLGYAPYYLMKPVLKKCTPEQLSRIEEYNPDLVDEDDELWKEHCDAQFRGQSPEEFESFRELFTRCQHERDMKLKRIAGNIRKTAQKAKPERRTMLAYVDSAVKPPKSVLRKQEKFGTAASVHFPEPGATGRGHSSSVIKVSGNMANCSLNSKAAMAVKKTKVAPLMQKSLKLMKTRFGARR